ncbi:MAG: DUF2304 domain-containing protein [Herbinix sp.]|nr:DUF2304 domain-containing protein [Herbinix sp.]
MGSIAKLFLIFCAILYTVIVIRLLLKRKIDEKNTILWLSAVFIILILAAIPDIIDKAAMLIGIAYPPSLLFLFTSLVLLFIVLRQAVQISILEDKVKELAQLIALQKQQDIQETKNNGKVD